MIHELTEQQIVAIYKAGMRRGNDEAVASYWGRYPNGSEFSELEDVLVWNKETMLIEIFGGLDYDEKVRRWKAMEERFKNL